MSRITMVAFALLDSALSIATLVQSSLTWGVVLLTVSGSMVLGLCSTTVRALLWPDYFWD